jgi:hypothetical protein
MITAAFDCREGGAVRSHSYDSDLALWAEEQARALRDAACTASNLPIDWENVAEEIESLGKTQARELASRIETILLHLIKLETSPSAEPRTGWRETIQEQRSEIEQLLADSPSLRPTAPGVITKRLPAARKRARIALGEYGEPTRVDPDALNYAVEQVIGDWFPDQVA